MSDLQPPIPRPEPVVRQNSARPARSVVLPALLIGLGVLFLLTNLGMIDATAWRDLWRWWPLVLVALGAELLLGRRTSVSGALFALLALAGIATGGFWASQGRGFTFGGTLSNQAVSVPLTPNVERAEVVLSSGVGRLDLRAGAVAGTVVSGQVQAVEGERVEQTGVVRDGALRAVVSSEGNVVRLPFLAQGTPRWDLRLSRDVPLDLTLRSGVGESNVDLTGLDVRSVRIGSGVGETTLTLPARGMLEAGIDGGVGEVDLLVPRGLEMRVVARAGLGGVDVDIPATRTGNVYVTPGFELAEHRADVVVNGGVGSVRVRWLDGGPEERSDRD